MAKRRPANDTGPDPKTLGAWLGDYCRDIRKRLGQIHLFDDDRGESLDRAQDEMDLALVDPNAPSRPAGDEVAPCGGAGEADSFASDPRPARTRTDRLFRDVQAGRSFLVFAEGGSGKTQLLQGLGWRLAGQPDVAAPGSTARVPVHVALRDLPVEAASSAQAFLDAILQREPPLAHDFALAGRQTLLRRLAAASRVTLLLDGLDEFGPDDAARRALLATLAAARQQAGGSLAGASIVLSSRPGYGDASLVSRLRLSRLKLEPLAPREVDRYLDRHARRFKAAILGDAPMRNLVRQPFLLALTCLLARRGEVELPTSAADLMERGIRELLHRRHVEPVEESLGILAAVALAAQQAQDNPTALLKPREAHAALVPTVAQPEARLKRLSRVAGFFEGDATRGYQLTNRVLGEYLAGVALAGRSSEEIVAAWSAHVWQNEWTSPLRWCAATLAADADAAKRKLPRRLMNALRRAIDRGEDDLTETLFRRWLDVAAFVEPAEDEPTWLAERTALNSESAARLRAIRPGYRTATVDRWVGRLQDQGEEEVIRRSVAFALGALGDPRGVKPLVNQLEDRRNDDELRWRAAGALGVLGDRGAVGPLSNRLADPGDDKWVRGGAAGALSTLGDPGVVRLLAKRLKDRGDDKWVRWGAAGALGVIGDPGAVKSLLSRLEDRSDDEEVRWRVAEALGASGDPCAVRPLASRLEDQGDDKWVRWEAAGALGVLGDPDAAKPLLGRLEDRNDDAEVRRAAAEALGALGDLSTVKPLLDRLEDDRDDVWVRRGAAEALGALGDPAAAKPLLNRLEDADDDIWVRQAAAEALGALGDPIAVKPLLRRLEDRGEHGLIRSAAAEALGVLSDPQAVASLVKCLQDRRDDEEIRRKAAAALGALGDPIAAEPLLSRLEDEGDVAGVQRAAAEALSTLLARLSHEPDRIESRHSPRLVDALQKLMGGPTAVREGLLLLPTMDRAIRRLLQKFNDLPRQAFLQSPILIRDLKTEVEYRWRADARLTIDGDSKTELVGNSEWLTYEDAARIAEVPYERIAAWVGGSIKTRRLKAERPEGVSPRGPRIRPSELQAFLAETKEARDRGKRTRDEAAASADRDRFADAPDPAGVGGTRSRHSDRAQLSCPKCKWKGSVTELRDHHFCPRCGRKRV